MWYYTLDVLKYIDHNDKVQSQNWSISIIFINNYIHIKHPGVDIINIDVPIDLESVRIQRIKDLKI